MNVICTLFGHKRVNGWYGDGLYGEVRNHGADGLGHVHYAVMLECDRCGRDYVGARFNSSQVRP